MVASATPHRQPDVLLLDTNLLLGQNDMWIAATAHVLDCELVTTDKDFDHLHGAKLRRRWIDPNSLRATTP